MRCCTSASAAGPGLTVSSMSNIAQYAFFTSAWAWPGTFASRLRARWSRKESTWRGVGVGVRRGQEFGRVGEADGCWCGCVAFLVREWAGFAHDVADGGSADVTEGFGENVEGAELSLV